MTDSISIVVPSLGSLANLQRLLDSVRKQEFSPAALEVIIVLNGVSDDHFEYLRAQIGVCDFALVLARLAAKNVNRARNKGIELAKHQVLLFLDDDCSLSNRKFLSQHVSVHSRKAAVFAIGGGYAMPDEAGFFDRIYNYLQMRWLTLGSLSGAAQFLLGGNFSVKSTILKEHQLHFDESIAYGGSEFEFFVKARRIGLRMESDMPDVLHHTRESLKGLTRKNYLQGRGAAIIDRKYPNRQAIGGKSITDPSQSFAYNLFFLFFNYVFWAGYHYHQGRIHQLGFRIAGDGLRAANFYRYEFLKKISQKISDKNQ